VPSERRDAATHHTGLAIGATPPSLRCCDSRILRRVLCLPTGRAAARRAGEIGDPRRDARRARARARRRGRLRDDPARRGARAAAHARVRARLALRRQTSRDGDFASWVKKPDPYTARQSPLPCAGTSSSAASRRSRPTPR
jgi:hypothetical protein